MQASERVIEFAGAAWESSLNLYSAGGNCLVATQQIDEWVYVVGRDSLDVARYTIAEWLDEEEQTDPPFVECENDRMAWEVLSVLRQDCLLWQCGACDAWIFTSDRPRLGRLCCSSCGDGGIELRHADRQVGGDDR